MGGKALAGNLSIRMRMTLSIVSDTIKVKVDATNHGTEPAHKLCAYLHIFEQSLASEILDRLKVHETRSFYFKVPIPSGKRGRFPFIGEVFFHDANRHPFSALSCAVFNLKCKSHSYLTGHVPDMSIGGKGNLSLLITNLTSFPRKCTATLYLPHGLTTPKRQKNLQLDPYGKRKADFLLKNRYGIGGATYPVFCTIEYDEKGINHVEIVRSTVRIKECQNWFVKTRWYWLCGMVPIVLWWGGLWLFRKRMR